VERQPSTAKQKRRKRNGKLASNCILRREGGFSRKTTGNVPLRGGASRESGFGGAGFLTTGSGKNLHVPGSSPEKRQGKEEGVGTRRRLGAKGGEVDELDQGKRPFVFASEVLGDG